MKRVELHVHFDGSLCVPYVNQLLGYDASEELVASDVHNLGEYLEKFSLPSKLLQTRENLVKFSYLLARDLVKDDVIYAEIRFCPFLHTSLLSLEEVIDAVLEGLGMVSEVKTNLILCMMRNFHRDKNMQIIKLAKKYLGKGVGGIDLAGDEAFYDTKLFAPLFEVIHDLSIPFTIHAGEAAGGDSILEAISFGAKRIGHGVRAIENSFVIDELVKNDVLLEVCPTSNVDTKIYDSIARHPIKKLMDLGVKVCLNTDNRTVSNTTLSKEEELLKKYLGFSEEDFRKCYLNAIDGAFLTEEEKDLLRNIILNS